MNAVKWNRLGLAPAVAMIVAVLLPAAATAAAEFDHVHLTASSPTESVKWYIRYLDCEPVEGRPDTVDCDGAEIIWRAGMILGGSPGTGINHIGFSYADLDAKMADLEAIGVRGSGVRLQRFEDGSTVRDIPGLFKIAFIFDPWGTRIELVEDAETLGFHHVHLSSKDPSAALQFYEDVFGGKRESLKGRLDGIRFDGMWLLASRHPEGSPASTEGRSIDHLGFRQADLAASAARMRQSGASLLTDPAVPENARSDAKRAYIAGPDNVRLAAVEPGFAGVDAVVAEVAQVAKREPYTAPRTPWGEPDLQGMWTGNDAHGVPLERPEDLAETEVLTAEEAAARRERGTLGSIWGYEREWRDTTLGYVKSAPSTQVAMVIDPPNGRLPEMTEEGKKTAASRGRRSYRTGATGPEDLPLFVRCITRGLPGIMMPGIYNNGLQIQQSPGYVAIQKEMIHETRIVPTTDRPPLGPNLKQYLGDSRGWWEGDTLVVEVTNFNGKASYRGAGENMKLTERYTRLATGVLEYEFTVEDPTIWTRPWTARFEFGLDNDMYELVEYACHEGNYGMSNILSGARARDKQAAELAAQQ